MRKKMFDIIWIIVASFLLFIWINGCIYPSDVSVSKYFEIEMFPDVAFSVLIILIIYAGLKWYCNQLRAISGEGLLLLLYERIYIPFIILITPFIYSYSGKASLTNLTLSDAFIAFSLFVMLYDPSFYVKKYIEERRFFNTLENSENILYLSFPPKKRSDIILIDIGYNLMIFLPAIIFS
jgi:hypothetical protein